MDRRLQPKRTFKIRTRFGSARKWRSRKNRPCDTCRRRKTACIIESEPPCRFCRSRGIPCRSAEDEGPHRQVEAVSRRSAEVLSQASTGGPTETTCGAYDLSSVLNATSSHQDSGTNGSDGILSPLSRQEARWSMEQTIETASLTPQSFPNASEDPTVFTLEDNRNRTAHNMGLCAEQDTDLLASFRSVIMNEQDGVSADIIQIGAGDSPNNIPPVHFNLLHDEFQPADDIVKARASETIESMVNPHGPALVRLFFKYVHPVYCVVAKTRFLKRFNENKLDIPASLRGAIYGLGSTFWKHEFNQEKLPFDLHDLFEEAQSSLQREFHAPNLWKLQACLLLLYERPADNATIETPRTWVQSAHTVACAQMIGLHRDPTAWNIAPWEKSLRTKLWWAAYNADIWSSLCHGNPPLIYPGSFTTRVPDMKCLETDEDLPADLHHLVDESSTGIDISTTARFEQTIKLNRILHHLIDSYYLDNAHEISMRQPLKREEDLLRIKSSLEEWASMMPQCTTMTFNQDTYPFRNNAPLNLAYFTVKALLFRAMMSPAKMISKSDLNSPLRRYFEIAVNEFKEFTLFMHGISRKSLYSYWGGHARSQLTLCGNFLIYLFLLASTSNQVRSAFELLESFHESLQRLREWAVDDTSLSLVRPVALRIDSFFIQAAKIMRTGM